MRYNNNKKKTKNTLKNDLNKQFKTLQLSELHLPLCNQETLLDLRVVVDSWQGGAIGLSGASTSDFTKL